jgi:hypothetical protein
MKDVKEFVEGMQKNLERGIIATPESQDQLLAFARANNGSNDIVLMQMAIQYGMKIAFQSVQSVANGLDK